MSSLPDLEGLAVFARVAELRSFTGAALELGLSKATISKTVTRLERRLGARLLNRSAHRLALTDAGRKLQARAASILAEAEAAEAECLSEAVVPRGLIRLAAPMSFGLKEVAPRLPAFLRLHAEVSVDLHLSDALVDLIGDGFDVALRIGVLPDSALLAKRLRPVPLALAASPAYLARRGAPEGPGDIDPSEVLGYAYTQANLLRFSRRGEVVNLRPLGRLRATSGDALTPALLDGLAMAVLPHFILEDHLAAGRLVQVLPDWSLPESALFLLTPPGGPRPARIQALMDYFSRTLADPSRGRQPPLK